MGGCFFLTVEAPALLCCILLAMIVAMVSWWNEDPSLISSCFEGMSTLGVQRVVAVDGVLDLYPGGAANSPIPSHTYVMRLAEKLGMEILLFRKPERWLTNEVGKRQYMLELALAGTKEEDWLLIWDTDYVLMNECALHESVASRLANTDKNYADVSYGEDPNNLYSARLFLRARKGLHLRTNHYVYWGPNDDQSWMLSRGDEDRALQMLDVRVHHNRQLRSAERLEGRTVFYERRDRLGVEWH